MFRQFYQMGLATDLNVVIRHQQSTFIRHSQLISQFGVVFISQSLSCFEQDRSSTLGINLFDLLVRPLLWLLVLRIQESDDICQ